MQFTCQVLRVDTVRMHHHLDEGIIEKFGDHPFFGPGNHGSSFLVDTCAAEFAVAVNLTRDHEGVTGQ